MARFKQKFSKDFNRLIQKKRIYNHRVVIGGGLSTEKGSRRGKWVRKMSDMKRNGLCLGKRGATHKVDRGYTQGGKRGKVHSRQETAWKTSAEEGAKKFQTKERGARGKTLN